MRALVESTTSWELVLLFVGGAIVLSLAAGAPIHALGLRSPSTGADTMVSSFAGRVTTLFGILLVFVIVAEFQTYQDAQSTVQNEATQLASLVRNTQSFPAAPRDRIRAAISRYGNTVVHVEWKLMGSGQESLQASKDLDGIQRALASFSPTREADKQFLTGAINNFDALVNARRDRIDVAQKHLPWPLLALLFAGAAVFTLNMFMFYAAKDSILVVMVILLAALAGAGLYACVVLDYPFSGSLAISNAVFHQGALGGLVSP